MTTPVVEWFHRPRWSVACRPGRSIVGELPSTDDGSSMALVAFASTLRCCRNKFKVLDAQKMDCNPALSHLAGKSPGGSLVDRNPAILVGKRPGRLASQGSPRRWGGAIPCTRDNRRGISTPHRRGVSTSRVVKKKKGLGAPFWLAVLANAGRTGSASSSEAGRKLRLGRGEGGAASKVVAATADRSAFVVGAWYKTTSTTNG